MKKVLIFLLVCMPVSAEIFFYIDENGKHIYRDKPIDSLYPVKHLSKNLYNKKQTRIREKLAKAQQNRRNMFLKEWRSYTKDKQREQKRSTQKKQYEQHTKEHRDYKCKWAKAKIKYNQQRLQHTNGNLDKLQIMDSLEYYKILKKRYC